MYQVKIAFTDLQDKNYKYKIGDSYPREGFDPSKERIAELSGIKNRRKKPLIERIAGSVKTESEPIKTDLSKARKRAERE